MKLSSTVLLILAYFTSSVVPKALKISANETADIYMSGGAIEVYALDTGAVTKIVAGGDFEGYAGVAYDSLTGTVYWSGRDYILYANVTNTTNAQLISGTSNYGSILSIAVDETTGDLYGTGLDGYIFVCNGTRTSVDPSCRILYQDPPGLFFALTLDTQDRVIYYTASTLESGGEVRRVGMDGSDPKIMISMNAFILAGIALDLEASKLYFTDYCPGSIYSSDLDGGNRTELINPDSPYALAIFGDRFYWSEPLRGLLASSAKDGSDYRVEYENGYWIYQLTVGNRTALRGNAFQGAILKAAGLKGAAFISDALRKMRGVVQPKFCII